MSVIPYPTMRQILEQAKGDVPAAKMLAAAIYMLMTHPDCLDLDLSGTYEKVVQMANEMG